MIDKAESRLQAAKLFGADTTVLAGTDDPLATVRSMTGGLGADVVIEAVGTPQTFELCTTLVRPGGRVANVGVHGKPATLHLEDLWIRNVTITTGLVDTYSTPKLLDMLVAGQLDTGAHGHPPVRARRIHAGVRRLRRPGPHRRPQGGAIPMTTLTRAAGASILLGTAGVLLRRALCRQPEWYDLPLPDGEDDLARQLAGGEISRSQYRQELELLAAAEDNRRPFTLPPGWNG